MTTKKKVKKEVESKVKQQDNIDEFISLAKELKNIVLGQNQRISEIESVVNRIKQRMGLWK